jgi:2-iminoacetate synthase
MFSKAFLDLPIDKFVSESLLIPESQVLSTLNKSSFSFNDLPVLLSPTAQNYIELLARRSQELTRQRFGNVIQLFIPMYLSNECFNSCSYCGFSLEHDYPRKTLTDSEIINEAKLLSDKGYRHILILTGESPKKVDVDYISNAIKLIKPFFSSIGIEIQPLKEFEYKKLIDSGADNLTLYQETYHLDSYLKFHTRGIKRNYANRLNCLEEGAKAGFFKINIGALLGLYDWRYEAFSLAYHLKYMMSTYWNIKYSISFPRIQSMIGSFIKPYPVTDINMVQLITVFRLLFPDLGITLSTREPAKFRDNIVGLGITTLSAESNTSPGGYSGCDSEEQFSINDTRDLNSIMNMLKNNGLDPVFKDWDYSLM